MAKILLINIDSTKPNLALEKLAKYHQDRGDEVYWDYSLIAPAAELIYVSVLYEQNQWRARVYHDMYPDKTYCGGTGWDVLSALPANIEAVKPKINLGFTTRGCIRNCPWCVVPEKEGKIRVVGDLLDLWNGKRMAEITLLDNNILALPHHFKTICRQAREKHLKLDFTQGLDCRLLTADLVEELAATRHAQYKFGFDRPGMIADVERAIDLMESAGLKQSTWYVLVGFNTTLAEDLRRLNFLRERKQAAFVMRYNRAPERRYIALAQWANQHKVFTKVTFEEFLKNPKRTEHREVLAELQEAYADATGSI